MTFLLDSDSIEVEGMPCDDAYEHSMRLGSLKLLRSIQHSRGELPQPVRKMGPPIVLTPRRKTRTLWPSWYQPPRHPKRGLDLLHSIAQDFGLTVPEMRGQGREEYLVDARATVAMVLRDRGMSFPQIARMIGRKDHSTALNLTSKFDIFCKRNAIVRESYERHRGEGMAL